MKASRGSARWRGRPNSGPERERRSAPATERFAVEGQVVWIERDRGLVHVELARVTDGPGSAGQVVSLDISAARLRAAIADRDRDGRIDIGDVTLGDTVQAVGATPSPAEGPVLRARRVTISERN